MPFRKRGALPASTAALLGLCLAGSGCQVAPWAQDAYAIRSGDGQGGAIPAIATTGGEVALMRPIATPAHPSARPIFTAVRRTPPPEPVLAPAAYAQPSAVVLTPVPLGSGDPASTWQPIERAGPEGDPRGDPRGGPSLDPPPIRTAPFVPVVAQNLQPGPLLPMPMPRGNGEIAVAPPGGRPSPGGGVADQLPMPREKGGRNERGQGKGQAKNGQGKGAQGKGTQGKGTGRSGFSPYNAPRHPLPAPDEPREFQKRALSAYVIEPPDVLLIRAPVGYTLKEAPVDGIHLVRPDGTVALGQYGSPFVAGKTTQEARFEVARILKTYQPNLKAEIEDIAREVFVDVYAYNSKFYYVIADGAGWGQQVWRFPITGNETVLDAIAQVQGLPPVAHKKHVWLARAVPGEHTGGHKLPVDWCGIVQRGEAGTNYQLYPGDRIFVGSDPRLRIDSEVSKFASPIERVLGVILLWKSAFRSGSQ